LAFAREKAGRSIDAKIAITTNSSMSVNTVQRSVRPVIVFMLRAVPELYAIKRKKPREITGGRRLFCAEVDGSKPQGIRPACSLNASVFKVGNMLLNHLYFFSETLGNDTGPGDIK
jgi:hypothetical protein